MFFHHGFITRICNNNNRALLFDLNQTELHQIYNNIKYTTLRLETLKNNNKNKNIDYALYVLFPNSLAPRRMFVRGTGTHAR